jgi:hypothetical protein
MGSMNLNASLSTSMARLQVPRARRGVQICEDANDVLEISTRSVRVERGDLELFYPEDYEPDPIIECFVCKYEAESDAEAGNFRIYNLPDGGWQLLCTKCEPPDDTWEFDRTVAVVDALLPPDLMQLVYLFLTSGDSRICAHVCRQWNSLSWTVLTLHDDAFFTKKITHPEKMRNVWVLRVYLHDAVSAAVYCGHLCDYLISVEALSELQLTGVSGDAPITRLAEALRDHRYLQVLDIGACEFHHAALTAVLSALEENEASELELILPRCCMDKPGHKFSSSEAAYQALDRLLSGTRITATLV